MSTPHDHDSDEEMFQAQLDMYDDQLANITACAMAAYRRHTQRSERRPIHGGTSQPRRYIPRDRQLGHGLIMSNYFDPGARYTEEMFRRRYRMKKSLFLKIMQDVCNKDVYFQQRQDATGRWGCTPEQKLTSVMRMLSAGYSADAPDEGFQIAQTTVLESFKKFIRVIPEVYGAEYLRTPTVADLQRLLRKAKKRGFPGMLGSLDCMHWEWKNCPVGQQGAYQGHYHTPTVILEAVAGYDTWIWHANFGFPGSNNDINVLDGSHLFDDEEQMRNHQIKYKVNGNDYTMGYYLVDRIYPKWATLIQTITNPVGEASQLFARYQESYRKDVERAFGILRARWEILKKPARGWKANDLGYIMKTCIILHNMIIEDERPENEDDESDDDIDHVQERISRAVARYDTEPYDGGQSYQPILLEQRLSRVRLIRSTTLHQQLKNDLVQHLWTREGSRGQARRRRRR